MRALITILDNITETSMPFNEFVLYRATHYSDEKQFLIVCGSKQSLPRVDIPDDMEIIFAGKNLWNIRKAISSATQRCKEMGIDYMYHLHQVQSGFLAQLAMTGTGFKKKTLFTVHSTFSGYKFHNKVLSYFNALCAARIACVSNASYKDYPASIKKLKGDRLFALQNGVDTERIDEVTKNVTVGLHNGVRFIYVARLIPIKNHMFLIDVIKKCNSNAHFVFVGAEDEPQTVRTKAREKGVLDRITFTGIIPRNEVFEQLLNSDYYISSSTLEGLPVSVLEGMYCGLPCILSDIPQHKEIAEDKVALLPYDIDVWADKINEFTSYSSEMRVKMSSEIREYVKLNYSLQKMHEKYDKVYELLR